MSGIANLEIKARCPNLAVMRERVESVATSRVGLDRVDGLGAFFELGAVFDGSPESEAEQQRKVRLLMERLGVGDADLLATSYEGLLVEADVAATG